MGRPYVKTSNGDLFLVQRDDLLLGLGLIARGKQKYIELGYFFHPNVWLSANKSVPISLSYQDAVYVAKFSALFIHTGTWPVVARLPDFDREKWPVPVFEHVSALDAERYYRVYRDEDKLSDFDQVHISRWPRTAEIELIAEDGSAGSEFVELKLARILGIDSDSWPERKPIQFYIDKAGAGSI